MRKSGSNGAETFLSLRPQQLNSSLSMDTKR